MVDSVLIGTEIRLESLELVSVGGNMVSWAEGGASEGVVEVGDARHEAAGQHLYPLLEGCAHVC